MTSLTVGKSGEIALPDALRERYGLTPDTPVRVVETRSGILLVPLTDIPMSAALADELNEWQALSTRSWDLFPYEDSDQ
jgi:bifunctional DNA-binding transcriptional regulator/antitoxin component of YhaV-PrlF toxin-antitoxin module